MRSFSYICKMNRTVDQDKKTNNVCAPCLKPWVEMLPLLHRSLMQGSSMNRPIMIAKLNSVPPT